jgi:hypothetical protein
MNRLTAGKTALSRPGNCLQFLTLMITTMANKPIPSVLNLSSKLRLCQSFIRAINSERFRLAFELEEGIVDQYAYENALIALDSDEEHLRKEIGALTEIRYQKAS